MFIQYVKQRYSAKVVERDKKWSLSPTVEYINLACIDRECVKRKDYEDVTRAMVQDGNVDTIQERKGLVEFHEIAQGISLPSTASKSATQSKSDIKEIGDNGVESKSENDRRLILVEGAPGVGKSTFAWEFCRRWLRGDVAQQYNLVLLLRLRDKGIRNARSLQQLISHPLPVVSEAVCHELVTSHTFHLLIILEGYDELPESQRSDSSSIFNELISGELLPLATVLVTSRPWATEDIRKNNVCSLYQHIEVLGFTKRQITEYIKKTVPRDQVKSLNSYLERQPQIKSGMYIPLNSAIVVAVYLASKTDHQPMPNTLSELYSAIVNIAIRRHMEGHPELRGKNMIRLSAVNISVPYEVHTNFISLCKLAYDGIIGEKDEVRLIFSESELPPNFDNLGFMDSATELYVTGETFSSHNFLHLTFQEFFAAVHISAMSKEHQVDLFMKRKTPEEGRLKVVLRFLAGLCKLDCLTEEPAVNIVKPSSTPSKSKYITPCDIEIGTEVVSWLFEAQSENALSLVLGERKVEFSAKKSEMFPIDYYSLGYCISHSKCQWVLNLIGGIAVSREKIKLLAYGFRDKVSSEGKIVGVGKFWNTDLKMFCTEWRSVLSLHKVRLRGGSIESWSKTDLSHLKVLKVDCQRLFANEYQTIASHLSSCTCLKKFMFYVRVLEWEERHIGYITEALATNTSLPLEKIVLVVESKMSDSDTEFLITFIRKCNTLQSVSLSSLTTSAHSLLDLLHTVYNHPTLQEKSLTQCACTLSTDTDVNALRKIYSSYLNSMRRDTIKYIGGLSDDGTVDLAEVLQHNYRSKELFLNYCRMSDDGVISLAKALHHNSTITALILCGNRIGASGTAALAKLLKHNSTLKKLELEANDVGAEGAVALATSLCQNTCLQILKLGNNNIGDEGAVALAKSLHQNSTLQSLDLINSNCIGDKGAVALAQCLQQNTTLQKLNLKGNRISDDGAVALAQALLLNKSMQELNLFDNPGIGDRATREFVQALTQTTSIKKLRLPKECKKYAMECQHYHQIQGKIEFSKF